ncbi:Hypothetical protein ETEE_3007 [Edwardsiella anguillarum ET080813]|uniref:Uncharacterized protein n=1 Tax=Edwardsiella anguillarum ET080813 TaxID=667120 RepID=A0A076LNE5_9GAMM|nr:Hypothetical protein ETEE_3007 [Edwardsiella anguillarum ET080813]
MIVLPAPTLYNARLYCKPLGQLSAPRAASARTDDDEARPTLQPDL